MKEGLQEVKRINMVEFKLKTPSWKFYLKIFLLGIFLGVLFWLIESTVHNYFFHEAGFLKELWPTDTNELWMRSLICILLFGLTFIYGYFYRRSSIFSHQIQIAHMALNEMNEAAMITDKNNKILYVNQRYSEITGYSAKEVIGKNPNVLSAGKQSKSFYQSLWHDLQTQHFWQGELWNRKKNGEIFPEWLSIKSICDQQGQPQYYIAIFIDISSKNASDELLKHYAYYDPLTDLPNRHFFNETLKRSLAQSKRLAKPFAILFLDLDKFKPVNDDYGHDVGDELLKDIGKKWSCLLREGDFLARVGGDEFIILLYSLAGRNDAIDVAERCISVFDKRLSIGEHELKLGVSVGGAFSDEVNDSPDELIKLADKRMYLAKNNGRNQYNFS